jgi:hypothetical protein
MPNIATYSRGLFAQLGARLRATVAALFLRRHFVKMIALLWSQFRARLRGNAIGIYSTKPMNDDPHRAT